MDADQASEAPSVKQISLPEPDPDNITVLTKELPNEPILPWHHFDSPWLEGDEDEKDKAKAESTPASDQTDADPAEAKDAFEKSGLGQDASEENAEEIQADADDAETLLVELKEKIEEEIELLEQSEPEAHNAEPTEEVEEIAELARELVSKLEAKKAVKPESSAPAQMKETQLEKIPVEETEDLMEERDEVE